MATDKNTPPPTSENETTTAPTSTAVDAAKSSGPSPTFDRTACTKIGPFYIHPTALLLSHLTDPTRAQEIADAMGRNGVIERIKVWDGDIVIDGVARLSWLATHLDGNLNDPATYERYVEHIDVPLEKVADRIAAYNVRRELSTVHRVKMAVRDLPEAEKEALARKVGGVNVGLAAEAVDVVGKRWATNGKYVRWWAYRFDEDLRQKVENGMSFPAAHDELLRREGEKMEMEQIVAERRGEAEGGGKPAGKDSGRDDETVGITFDYLLKHNPDEFSGALRVTAVAARIWHHQQDAEQVKALIAQLGKALEAFTREPLPTNVSASLDFSNGIGEV